MIRVFPTTSQDAATRMWQLQQAAYRVEAELIGWSDLPPLRETVEELMGSEETFIAYVEEGELAGALSFQRMGDQLDIHKMIVDPKHFRKGIARQLLLHLETIYPDVKTIVVSTGARNEPAVQLYLRQGYESTGTKEVAPGLELAFFRKEL
ncbi:GNAT family N-acetyltransferase [Brevibacillus choshinensis]|uniref:GNAT family N-acetyltransferase n=1 Tax=Brevibacillus choshinensis TaxID=54911 RepID=UPI002E219270|nr:GNAT family N-acetyltransferase [Brevibacillus choshinensis]